MYLYIKYTGLRQKTCVQLCRSVHKSFLAAQGGDFRSCKCGLRSALILLSVSKGSKISESGAHLFFDNHQDYKN